MGSPQFSHLGNYYMAEFTPMSDLEGQGPKL